MSSVVRSAQGEFTLTFYSGFTDAYYAIYGTIQYGPLANTALNTYGGFLNVGRSSGNKTGSAVTVGAEYPVDAQNYDPIYVSVVCTLG
jgi:hypothetical protein